MLQQFLEQNKETIIAKWIEEIIDTYEPEMIKFLHKENNQFANPVRNTIITSANNIYAAIIDRKQIDKSFPGLEDLIKLRAVQDFSPSHAVLFMFQLKNIINNTVEISDQFEISIKQLIEFNNYLDTLIQIAFDVYTDCRSKIYELRIKEIKAQSKRAFDLLA